MDFEQLVEQIGELHVGISAHTTKAVNLYLTSRNWFIGAHIKEYELRGEDRAKSGRQVFKALTERLSTTLDRCSTERYLRLCRQLYEVYPQIGNSVISDFDSGSKWKSLISKSKEDAESSLLPGRIRELASSSSNIWRRSEAESQAPTEKGSHDHE